MFLYLAGYLNPDYVFDWAFLDMDVWLPNDDTMTFYEIRAYANNHEMLSHFYYYFEWWENFHILKCLPHGRGWLAEKKVVIQVIKILQRCFNLHEAAEIERATQRADK